MPTSHTPSVDRLKRALHILEQIQELEAEVASLLGGQAVRSEAAAPTATEHKTAGAPAAKRGKKRGGKRFVSPEARAKMAAAQSARWARFRKSK